MLTKLSNLCKLLIFSLTLFLSLSVLAQQQSVSTTTKSNSTFALNKAKQPDAPTAIEEHFFNGLNDDDELGRSVASAGDVNGDGYDDLIIGAPKFDDGASADVGRAYIYYGGNIIDNSVDVILTGDGTVNFFGISVSTAGDVNGDGYADVIVGSSSSSTGKCYIFFGGVSMNNAVDVTMSNIGNFGESVSDAGDVNGDGFDDVIVGAWADNSLTGKSYIFYGGSTMNNTADVIMSEDPSNVFGWSVSTAGDVNGDGFSDVIVGAWANNSSTGKSYIYFGGTSMNNIADVTISGEISANKFGVSVSTAGDVNGDGFSDVIIGADGNNSSTGKSYIFFGSTSLSSTINASSANVKMSGEATNDLFGISVSIAGDVNGDGYSDVIVGAEGNNSSTGKSYIFYGGSSMNNIADIAISGKNSNDFFGHSVSNAGDMNSDGYSDFIIGAYWNDANGNKSGSAYLYTNSQTGVDIPDNLFLGINDNDNFGRSVSDVGDVNNDGYDDFIVGADGYLNERGRAYIYFGGADMDYKADIILTGENTGDRFGFSVSGAGDVNNDGIDDVIVGAIGFNGSAGKAYVYFGGLNMNNVPDVLIPGQFPGDNFGWSVSSAENVNNDLYDDFIVGAPNYNDGGSSDAGRVYIYFGGSSVNNFPNVIMTGEDAFDYFGFSVSNAGNVNDDNYSDVIVGAYGHDNAISNSTGKSYIYFGGSSMNSTADVTMFEGDHSFKLGYSVSSAGDVNGDGVSDVIVGAIIAGGNIFSGGRGKSFIYFGASSMNNGVDVVLNAPIRMRNFGRSVSTAGDVNGDGYSDVVVSAKGFYSTGSWPTTVIHPDTNGSFIFFGGSNMDDIEDVTMTSKTIVDEFGYSVSKAGDINGDGLSDVIIGDYLNDNIGSNRGSANLYLSSWPQPSTVMVDAKIYLEGPYGSPDMSTAIHSSIPNDSPYGVDPQNVNPIPPNVVDWVLVELRNKIDPTILEGSRSAFVLSDGTVVDTDGSSSVSFPGVLHTKYYIVIKHRNHLGVMSSTAVNVN